MNNQQRYQELCASKKEIGLFQNSIWLDAIGSKSWDTVLAIKGTEVLGALPFFHKRKMGFDIITMPPLTAYLGPVLFYPEGQKPAARLAFEKEILGMLINQLPKTDKFIQYFQPYFQNGLPFQWAGYEQSVRYTYILSDTSNPEKCWDGLQGNVRRIIKKARTKFKVEESVSSDSLFQLKTEDYKAKKQELEFDEKYLKHIHKALRDSNSGKILEAKNSNGQTVAAVLLGWDTRCMHYVAGAMHTEFRASGALSLLIWKGIELASEKNLEFNLEGGMIESIERYFRGFGAEPVPYFQFLKIDSKLLNLL